MIQTYKVSVRTTTKNQTNLQIVKSNVVPYQLSFTGLYSKYPTLLSQINGNQT